MSTERVSGWTPRILLVDDQPETRALLRGVLEGEGIHIVGEAEDGSEAVEMTGQLAPEVILMDLRMPGMGGLQATRIIKDQHPDVQVILLTFYDELLPVVSPEEVGAFAYLIKGCPPGLMRDVILQAWSHAPRSQEGQAIGG